MKTNTYMQFLYRYYHINSDHLRKVGWILVDVESHMSLYWPLDEYPHYLHDGGGDNENIIRYFKAFAIGNTDNP